MIINSYKFSYYGPLCFCLFILLMIFISIYFHLFYFRDKNGEDSNAGGLNNAVMQLRKVRETQFKRLTRRREKKTLTIICLSSII